ncbi:MAG: hydantoinase/oxoprolinase family protein [Candidatus Hydrothermarchaeaceae archaeon]
MKCAAYDIGGANTKRLVAETINGFEVLSSDIFYFPLWKQKDDFEGFFRDLAVDADATAVAMSAEFCDCFASKTEGVEYIISTCDSVLGEPFYLTMGGALVKSRDLDNPSSLAAANFVASLAYLEDNFEMGILLDMGSTTTDIVPFERGKKIYGMTDFERLAMGQLVYTGLLRTPLCALVREVPYKGRNIGMASEVFAISADVYNILGKCDYTCETPDGRDKTFEDSTRRLARQLCADLEEIDVEELRSISLHIRDAQVGIISHALREVSSATGLDTAYLCGVGKEVASMACVKAGLKPIDLANKTPAYENLPCLGLAWMMINR